MRRALVASAATTAACLAASGAAVAWAPPITHVAMRQHQIVLAYHDQRPPLWGVLVVAVMVVAPGVLLGGAARLLAGVVAGAVVAQWAAWVIWGKTPDYIHVFGANGVIANAADLAIIGSAVVAVVLGVRTLLRGEHR